MFPFDRILLDRIKDLERHNESLMGANSVLERELEKSQNREGVLQDKLFKVSGIDSPPSSVGDLVRSTMPIKLRSKTSNWPEIKANLEAKAKEDYWNQKNQEAERKSTEYKIEDLEKEVLGE